MERELYNLKIKIITSEKIPEPLREELANDVFEIEKLVNKTNDIHSVSCCEHHDAYVVDQHHRKCRDCGKELYNKDYS